MTEQSPASRPEGWRDYSHEVKLIQSPVLRYLLMAASCIFLLAGIIGVFLPLLPTTPFVLLAGACYARSSTRFYNGLMNHKVLGPPLRRWKEQRRIDKRTKIIALSTLAATLVPTIWLWIPILAVKILLAICGIAVASFILLQKS